MPPSTRSRKNAFQIFSARWTDTAWLRQYLNEEESDFVAATVRDYRRQLPNIGPPSVMRLEGIVILYVLARRAGMSALSDSLLPESDEAAKRDAADSEDVGKAQERLRKALKDFEDALGAAPATASGLADILRPLLKDAEGVVEESLASGNGHHRTD